MKVKEILKEKGIPEEIVNKLKTSFEIIGDVTIIKETENLEKYTKDVAKAVMKANKSIKTVLKKADLHKGTFRTQKLDYVLGENKKETIEKENGIKLLINPEEVYFSSKLSTERQNLLKNLEPKKILVMFSGVGPYSFVAYNYQPNHKIILSIEINPKGHRYAIKNIELNKSIGRRTKIFKEITEFLKNKNLYFNEKHILRNINNLKLVFINGDVKKIIPKLKLTTTWNNNQDNKNGNKNNIKDNISIESENNPEIVEDTINIEEINFKDIYKIKNKNIIIDKKSKENLYKFIICSLDNIFTYNKTIFKNPFEKNILLNILNENLNEKELENLKKKLFKFDEIFMPLPKSAELFLEDALKVASENTKIHLYGFLQEEEFPYKIIKDIKKVTTKKNIEIKIEQVRKVGQYAPRKYRVCCDFTIEKINK